MNLRFTIYDLRFAVRRFIRGAFVLSVIVLSGSISAFAADVPAEFSTANKLYAEGKFADAAGLYEKMIEAGTVSSSLWFNDGNAEFKAGNPGKAIVAYRRAELIAPRDAEIRANLDFVRRQTQGQAARQPFWQNGLSQLTADEWTWLAMLWFWLTFLVLALRQLRPAWAPKFRGTLWSVIALTILFSAAAMMQVDGRLHRRSAVVVAKESIARSGPFDDAQTMFTTRDGAEFVVEDQHGDWIRVVDASGRTGWLSTGEVEIVPDA